MARSRQKDNDSTVSGARQQQKRDPPLVQSRARRRLPSAASNAKKAVGSKRSASKAAPNSIPRPLNPRALGQSTKPAVGEKDKACAKPQLDLRSSLDGQKSQVDMLLKLLNKKKKIVVVAGAGISVGAGIPDFRSSSGLFTTLRSDFKLKSSGKELFDASVYKDDQMTSSFHDMVRELHAMSISARPTEFHHLLATLAKEERLLRLYSQNVDCIDTQLEPLKTCVPLGVKAPWPRTIQLHGGLEKMVCSKCHWMGTFLADMFYGSEPPDCMECVELEAIREIAGKRSLGIGKLRPRIVLYNEYNPDADAIGAVTNSDLKARPDALIVVGTSLKVPGVRRIVREMCGVVRDFRGGMTVWINEEDPPAHKDFEGLFDLVVKGDCEKVARLAAMPRWDGRPMNKTFFEVQIPVFPPVHTLKPCIKKSNTLTEKKRNRQEETQQTQRRKRADTARNRVGIKGALKTKITKAKPSVATLHALKAESPPIEMYTGASSPLTPPPSSTSSSPSPIMSIRSILN